MSIEILVSILNLFDFEELKEGIKWTLPIIFVMFYIDFNKNIISSNLSIKKLLITISLIFISSLIMAMNLYIFIIFVALKLFIYYKTFKTMTK